MSNQIELKAFGERVRTKRIELGLSQEAFAKKCGYTDRSSIAKIEKGEIDVSRSKIVAIASVLGVSPAYLMGWDESNTNHGVNNGIIGDNNNGNVFNGESLSEFESELFAICKKMTVTQKAKLLTFAAELVENK